MQLNINTLKKNAPSFILGLSALLFIACGAHQESDYRDNDGIYATQSQTVAENGENTSKDSYYKQYFNSKTDSYQDLPDEGAIFTDIDAYHTTESMNEEGEIIIEEVEEDQYAGWGENSGQVTVNVYDNGFNNGFGAWGWNRPYWWYGAGWGYSNYWYGPYYGIGFGWGYPYYGYYGYGYPIYNGGYYNNYYNPYYGNPYNGYAYTRGRRNSDYHSGRNSSRSRNYDGIRSNRELVERGRSNATNQRFSRESRSDSRSRNARTTTYRPNSQSSRTRPNTSTSRRSSMNSRSTRSSRPNVSSPRTTRPAVQSRRSSTRSSSPSRSSSTRSTGGRTRSSGGASRGGGSRRGGGRGN